MPISNKERHQGSSANGYGVPASAFTRPEDINVSSLPRMPTPEVQRLGGPTGPAIREAHEKRRFITIEGTNPLALFTPAINICTIPAPRWIHTDNEHKASVLLFTDGSAPNNGQPGVRAGCGVVYEPGREGISFPLERSPQGHALTSNRAELRAVLAALEARYWPGEGFARIVVATDSEYVVKGICERIEQWRVRGWKLSNGNWVKNQDLWKMLLTKVEEFEQRGISVQFFWIKREWNGAADRCAKAGAENPNVPSDYEELLVLSF